MIVTDWTLNLFDNTGSPTERQRVAHLTVVLCLWCDYAKL